MTPEQRLRLPKYVQRHIESLEHGLELATALLPDNRRDGPIAANVGLDRKEYFSRGTAVEFRPRGGGRVEVSIETDFRGQEVVHVRGSDALSIRPQAANSFSVIPHPNR
jgi:hypothetical protein